MHMDWDIVGMDHKRPFYYILRGNPFGFTSVEKGDGFRTHLLIKFLKQGVQSWVLEDFSTQLGILTRKAASISDFNWTQEHISAIIKVFKVSYDAFLT